MLNITSTLHEAIAISEKQNKQPYREAKQEPAKYKQTPALVSRLFKPLSHALYVWMD
jgi:hypothetical protein